MAQIKEIALTDLRPDPQNVNIGTEPGSAAHENSIRHNGLGRSILATADNVILAGNKTYEQAGQLGAAKRVVAVDVEGDTLVVVRRTDLVSGTPEAVAMALADNRTSQLNYAPDEALLASLLQDLPTVEAAGYSEAALDMLLASVEQNGQQAQDDNYSRKIVAPIYTPKGECPPCRSLYDRSRADEMRAEIEAADLPEEVALFLLNAAERHTVFQFDKIAEFYAHAPASTQRLMERSALVIIDFEQAIELGYVQLTKQMLEQVGIGDD